MESTKNNNNNNNDNNENTSKIQIVLSPQTQDAALATPAAAPQPK